MVVIASLLLAQAAAGGWSMGRPTECGYDGGRRPNIWERAKSPDLRHYCDLVASAASKLAGTASMAAAALEAAREADGVLPGRGAPRVLEGRALAALGRMPEALTALRDARTRDPRALDDPASLLAFARVLATTGHGAEAADAYRAVLPRAVGLGSSERTLVALEAGLVAMGLGPDRIEEATADLREALRDAQQGDAEDFVVLALSLSLDRAGKTDEAGALLAERQRGDPRAIVSAWTSRYPVGVSPPEASALAALALATTDAAGAREGWEENLRLAPQGPWAAHARAQLASLGRRGVAPGNRRAGGGSR
jgi:tetratricopeptide (TPR) repeat protein